MKSILYIGNKLNSKRSNVSAITIIGGLLEKEGFQLYYASSKINKIARLIDMLKTCIVYRNKVDFVIIDTYSTWNFYFALLVSQLCRVLGLKYITRLNGGNLPVRLEKSALWSKLIFNHAYISISPSLYLKQKFNDFGYHNVKYIPNALDISKYPFLEKKYDTPKLLWVRSFSKIYNPKMAVSVVKALIDRGYRAELCMVGPDSDGSFQQVVDYVKILDVNVKFTGKITKDAWIKLSEDYNIFINTTNYDNTPVSVMEAMALGLPVVSTNVGGMPYLIDNTVDGMLTAPKKPDEMTSAIIKLLSDRELVEKTTINARKKVESFDWEVVKQQWINILQ